MRNIFKILLGSLFILLSVNLSAQTGFDPNNYDSYFKLENYLTSSPAIQKEINYSCAIFISPTDEQIKRMIRMYGEETYLAGADDNAFQMFLASEMMKTLGVEVVELKSGVIKLKGKNRMSWTLDTSKKGTLAWNLIFFNVNKPPKFIPAVDVTEFKSKEFFDQLGD